MVRQEGLEPPAYCLEGSCSIQLSYWRIAGNIIEKKFFKKDWFVQAAFFSFLQVDSQFS
jgi:hypothetical protein